MPSCLQSSRWPQRNHLSSSLGYALRTRNVSTGLRQAGQKTRVRWGNHKGCPGLPLQFVLAVLKRGTLGARASGPHPRVAPKVTQGPMSIGRGTLKAGDSGSDHTSKMGLLPIPPVTRLSAGMTCWGGIGRRECFLSRVKRKNRFPSRGRWCRVAASSSGRSNSTGSTGRSRPGGVETTTHGKKRDRTGRR
jgi:hypothetical protein